MPIQDKTITARGLTVLVFTEYDRLADGTSRFRATATIGDTVLQSVLVVHPNPDIDPTLERMQDNLDDFRDRLATEAAVREKARIFAEQLT